MERTEVLNRMAALRTKERTIFDAYFERWDAEMEDKTSEERRSALLYGKVYTTEERSALDEIHGKINGLRHILRQGFLQEPRPQSPEQKMFAELLY